MAWWAIRWLIIFPTVTIMLICWFKKKNKLSRKWKIILFICRLGMLALAGLMLYEIIKIYANVIEHK